MSQLSPWLLSITACAGVTYFSLLVAINYLRSLALAFPNPRSGHTEPTPQGAGLIVIPVVVIGTAISLWTVEEQLPFGLPSTLIACSGSFGLMLLGFADDVRGASIALRLCVQAAIVGALLFVLPTEFRVGPTVVPLIVERIFWFLTLVWFINAVNFMDGMDWMSAVETIAISGGVILLALFGYVDVSLGWCAAALLGATLAFMPFNAPPARIFLGDAGSLPLGLLLGLLLLAVAVEAPGAAFILPLYYLSDTSITLASRILRGERFWEGHREHFYQRALRNGLSVKGLIARLALLHAVLVLLAFYCGAQSDYLLQLSAVVLALSMVGGMLLRFARPLEKNINCPR